MATVVDICNLALSHLGDKATVASIEPPEGSPQASHCSRFYPVARDFMLEAHDWGFNTARAQLADQSVATPPPSPWQFAYALPANCLRLLSVLPPDADSDDRRQAYVRETAGGADLIYCNQSDAVARYTWRVLDPTRFSPLFVDAVSRLLASYLAGPVIKGDEGARMADAQFKAALAILERAKLSDSRQVRSDIWRDDLRGRPAWLRDRLMGVRHD